MEQNRKHLKIASAIVLLSAAVAFLRVAGKFLFTDSGIAILPDGSAPMLKLIVRIVLAAIVFVFLMPRIYVGVRGLYIAKKPSAAKGHIVWAYILLVFTVFGLIEPILAAIQPGGLSGNAYALVNGVLSAAAYIYYLTFARAVAKAN